MDNLFYGSVCVFIACPLKTGPDHSGFFVRPNCSFMSSDKMPQLTKIEGNSCVFVHRTNEVFVARSWKTRALKPDCSPVEPGAAPEEPEEEEPGEAPVEPRVAPIELEQLQRCLE